MKRRKKLGLALGGGASKGVSMFSIIENLQKEGVVIDYIAGASIGSIIGAYYALYGEVSTLKKDILGLTKKGWFDLIDMHRFPKESLIKAKKFREYLESKFGNNKFSDLKIPLVVSVTNLTKGRTEYITKGKLVDAIVMSSSYPGIFPPVKKGKNLFVDGGVLDNLPYEILFKKKMKKIICINLSGKNEKKDLNNIVDFISSSIDLMMEHAFKGFLEGNEKMFVFRPLFKKSFSSSWNISNLDKKYDAGNKEFKKKRYKFLKWLE